MCSININPKHYFIHWTELLHYSIIFPGKTFMALIKNILFSHVIFWKHKVKWIIYSKRICIGIFISFHMIFFKKLCMVRPKLKILAMNKVTVFKRLLIFLLDFLAFLNVLYISFDRHYCRNKCTSRLISITLKKYSDITNAIHVSLTI